MIVLGVDTSGRTLSVAAGDAEGVRAEYVEAMGRRHAVTCQSTIDRVLERCGWTLADVDCFAVATGPGSFTGIRIGIAAVKAMAYAVGADAVGISSLRALARSTGTACSLVAPVLDARAERVYSALYRDGVEVLPEAPRTLHDWVTAVRDVAAPGERIYVVGDGIPVIERAEIEVADTMIFAPRDQRWLRASAVMALALEDLANGVAETDPFRLEARYISLSSAERAQQERASRA